MKTTLAISLLALSAATHGEDHIYRVSAPDLMKGYEQNAYAQDQKMQGKAILVSGKVSSITTNPVTGAPQVILWTGNDRKPAFMNIRDDDEAKSQVAALRSGSSVQMYCFKMREQLGRPNGDYCSVFKVIN